MATWKGDTGNNLPDYESEGRTFESIRARQQNQYFSVAAELEYASLATV